MISSENQKKAAKANHTFHQSISKVLLMSQIFALLPVSNVHNKDVKSLYYSWFSVRSIYATIILVLNSLEFMAILKLLAQYGLSFHISGSLSFFTICILEHIYFWRLAIKWPHIMKVWYKAEKIFLRPPYTLYANYNMKFRINFLTFLVMLGAYAEHCVLVGNGLHEAYLEHSQCKLKITFWENVYRRDRYHLYNLIPYNVWLLPFLEWINLTMAYPRSFTSAFIVCISVGLAKRFHQLLCRIEAVHDKAMSGTLWNEILEHFLAIKRLLRIINDEITPLILLSSLDNFYFIGFQLFNSFQNIGGDAIAVFAFWYSLLYAIFRSAVTLYTASTINEYGKRILSVLRCVPSKSYCVEVQRFSHMLSVDIIAFTGGDFFYIKRGIILGMASTLVTYELMVSDIINKGSIQTDTNYCPDVEEIL